MRYLLIADLGGATSVLSGKFFEETLMKFIIPQALQSEHEVLHERLRRATQAGGEVGEAAKAVARLMRPHFAKEDEFALPPLGLLGALARGEVSAEMAAVLQSTDRLEAELPQMREEHRRIVDALSKLSEAAARANLNDVVAFAAALVEHAQIEETVMYPAAILVGQVVRQRLAIRGGTLA
ncbi:MAG: hemerythrin domain-containing protein [Hydrogenophaga sp.]|jgi:hemerythrin-like domain-containing protein|nr:hemerythrin domain-containing protein [Hydrogenophaga sp.]